VPGGLIVRVVGATLILALAVGTAFALLLRAISAQRESAAHALESQSVLASANRLQRLVIDLESGSRGYLLTGETRFLQPWSAARDAIEPESALLQQRAMVPEQHQRATQIAAAIESYLNNYSVPLVDAAIRGDPSARSLATSAEGKNQLDRLRAEFDAFETAEHRLAATRDANAAKDAQRAVIGGSVGLGISVLLTLLLAAYLARSVVAPVRRSAVMADRVAGGDLSARLPETETGEIGTLERSFNQMGRSLELSRKELDRLLRGQAALRRVATLVARGEEPNTVFTAVVEEVGDVLGAEGVVMLRREVDNSVTVMASSGPASRNYEVGSRMSIEGGNVAAEVMRTGQAASQCRFFGEEGSLGRRAAEDGIRLSVGAPVLVAGGVWGVIDAMSVEDRPPPAETEERLTQFTDLVATAVANSQARQDLAASRVRLVAASDQTRRRIERDLHDGTQQRLVSLALDLRGAEAGVPDEQPELREQLARIADGLGAALDDLREISRGIHPAILSEGGLVPALKALARRSRVPVELTTDLATRPPQPVEVAAYYAVAEVLTNAAKHAQASLVVVEAALRDGALAIEVTDDGVGGADPAAGSGLIGLTDRIEALNGRISITSPPGEGTRVQVVLPTGSDGGTDSDSGGR
jgi:signal transduction histidine kinase